MRRDGGRSRCVTFTLSVRGVESFPPADDHTNFCEFLATKFGLEALTLETLPIVFRAIDTNNTGDIAMAEFTSALASWDWWGGKRRDSSCWVVDELCCWGLIFLGCGFLGGDGFLCLINVRGCITILFVSSWCW